MNQSIARMIDHTLLKADVTKADIITLAQEANEYQFASVCINPTWVKTAYEQLKEADDVKVCTVIGFPLGATTSRVKAFETEQAIKDGATEIDMVINIGELKDKNDTAVLEDIKAVVGVAKGQALTKVIIETSLLSEEEKIKACQLSVEAGADFVKTSTGFSTAGATIQDIKLMRETVGPSIGVKASGGVRDRQTALAMIEAGATRIGASAGIAIVNGGTSASDY
ncbi:deoxyribose-phosphate aldolase [Desertibacillus haloalkaliphilus]|uniref:deoxyribose-phosphate aldolase n=1 Tax=Desertibacillus haloalkaliphilus TaxID=1328930 RepID=UPI001C281243|nr:deoxyribose-phosphate aldolase [Desertibacillus haloalkaliphilus]MBU8905637.1 deoxyribose-phosphate aldolase [Desertibacillus haloalkaliphilus]